MRESDAERLLATAYIFSVVFSVVSLVSLVTAWQHWAWTLDVCINIDCGCILYGINTFSTFMGGDGKLCHFGAYGLIPVTVIGLCLGGYHGYRCCINKNLDEPRPCQRDKNDTNGRVVVVGPKRRSPYKQWMLTAFIALLVCFLSLAHAVVMTDGYYKTCEQYRRNLIQLLGSRGREAEAIHNRLSCGAILDFMDYLQPDANNWRRGSEINTGIALQLAIVSTWSNFIAWAIICLVNIVMGRRRLSSLGERLCCCC